MIEFIRYRFDALTRILDMELIFHFDIEESFTPFCVDEDDEDVAKYNEIFRLIGTICFDSPDYYDYRWFGNHVAYVYYSDDLPDFVNFSEMIVLVGEKHKSNFFHLYIDALCFTDDLDNPDVISVDSIKGSFPALMNEKGYISLKLRLELDDKNNIAVQNAYYWE